ncbi:TetR family transcriptional regulator [Actinomadura meridiana]|uniref:TetR family transcriptional regulator n=1 Tax=Actinomadura meridiana TaxID=559626 RepID=A0ABP8BRC8_9ACTN
MTDASGSESEQETPPAEQEPQASGNGGGRSGRGPGRRPGPTETRERILAEARDLFAEKGYDGTSLRAIARAAGVDPALVHHFFGHKEGVFVEALRFPVDPAVALAHVTAFPRDRFGELLARTFLGIWGDEERRAPLLAILRSAMTNERASALLREFVTSVLYGHVGKVTGAPQIQVQAAASQLIGMMILRYVVRVEPLASASEEELVELVAPVIQHYFVA